MDTILNYSWIVLVGLLIYGLFVSWTLPRGKKHHDNRKGSHYYESNKKRRY